MDRFLEVLRVLEMDPSKTNDLKAVDCFNILLNFILECLGPSKGELTKAQLSRFILVLEKYVHQDIKANKGGLDYTGEKEHMTRRAKFVKDLARRDYIQQLKDKLGSMDW
jgi:hypothetical protein